jgi:hypothetical protein
MKNMEREGNMLSHPGRVRGTCFSPFFAGDRAPGALTLPLSTYHLSPRSTVTVWKSRALIVPALLAALASCADQPTEAPVDPEPKPAAPLPLGVFEIQIVGANGAGGEGLHASKAVPVPFGPDLSMSAVNSGITLEVLSSSSFTDGTRGQGGQRYISVTYRIRNTTGAPLTNLTFIPTTTASTIPGSPFSSLLLFNNTSASTALATQVAPTGAAFLGEDGRMRTRFPDVLQAFTEAEVAAIALPAGVTGIFPYGFVTSNPKSASDRVIPNAASANEWGGMVTFAFRYPLQTPSAASDPFFLTFQVLAVQDTETRLTESIEEGQDSAGVRRARERASALGATTVTVLNGSTAMAPEVADYPGQRQLCAVRTAGTPGSPLSLITRPAAYRQLAVLYPGEGTSTCGAYFRTGAPGRPATNVPFNVTLRAMDLYGNLISTAADTVALRQLSGPPVALPASAALSGGSATVAVTWSDYGTSLLNAVGRRNEGLRSLPVAGVTRTWTAGAGTTDWHTNGNWSPAAVPMALDSVLVPAGTPQYPLLAANVQVAGVTVAEGATLGVGAFDLTASANVLAGTTGGVTNTTGRVVLVGSGATVQGRLPRLRVTGTYSLSGNVTARGTVQVDAGHLLDTAFRLQVDSN